MRGKSPPRRFAVPGALRVSIPWLRRLFLIAAGLYLFYLVGMNALFWSGAFEAFINRSQSEVHLRLGHAWTVRPFVVHARDVAVVVNERTVQLEIEVDEVEVGFDVMAFRDRLVHMRGVRGGPFVFHLRRRISPREVDSHWLASLPPMLGLPPPILFPDPHPDEDLSNNWNVRMEDVDAALHEVWIDDSRFLGRARLRGGFTLMTEQTLEIAESSLALAHGVAFVAHRPFAAALEGEIGVSLSEITFAETSADDVLRALRVAAAIDAFLIDAGAVGQHLPEAFETRGGLGWLRLDGQMNAGVIEPGYLGLDLEDVVVRRDAIRWRTPVRMTAASDGRRLAGRIVAGGSVTLDGVPITISHAELEASAQVADLRAPASKLRGKLDVQGGAAALRIESKQMRLSGALSLSTQLELSDDVLAGAVGLRFREGHLRWGELALDGTAGARIYLRGSAGPLRLDAAEGAITLEGDVSNDEDYWHARIALAEAQASAPAGRIGVDVTMESLGPLFATPITKEAPDLAIALLDLEDVTAKLRATWGEGDPTITLVGLECDACSATGRWHLGDGGARGAMLIGAGPVRAGIAMGPDGSQTTLFPDDAWLRRHPGAVGAARDP